MYSKLYFKACYSYIDYPLNKTITEKTFINKLGIAFVIIKIIINKAHYLIKVKYKG